jgi:hypothetical protein
VAVNFDVEGRIGDHHLGYFPAQQPPVVITTKGVATHQVVAA